MASFFEQLWESIFTPGPTPTLLVATNASFAALQLLFFAMLIATYSIHFIILSFLCAGLWKRRRSAFGKREGAGEKRAMGQMQTQTETGDDTEVDGEAELKQTLKPKPKSRSQRSGEQSTVFVDRPAANEREGTPQASQAQVGSGPVAAGTQGTTTSLAPLVDDALKKRKGMGDSTGDLLGTDSEWEKLSADSGDK
ncbi:Pkr1-domain-containing protein [Plenodomus tracheiphilus IPT5]|uniref:Pkr1-domain-containing protein n=1 Tax=Plenodomus tracheiphilus IPT5 TaxID=1408161 RepID=A0A6A7BA77_9PLEO|nr:Pkr1-domain-containing protein [Plenodomus tracheiphilus IPT5]